MYHYFYFFPSLFAQASFVDIVRADIQEQQAVVGDKYELNPNFAIDRKCPRVSIFAVQFVRIETRVERIQPKQRFFAFSKHDKLRG